MRAEASEEASYICHISRIATIDDNAQCIPRTARTVKREWYERGMQPLLPNEDNATIDMARPILLERMDSDSYQRSWRLWQRRNWRKIICFYARFLQVCKALAASKSFTLQPLWDHVRPREGTTDECRIHGLTMHPDRPRGCWHTALLAQSYSYQNHQGTRRSG